MIIDSLKLKNGEIYRNIFIANSSELESFGYSAVEAAEIWLTQAKVDAIKEIKINSKIVRDLVTGGVDYIRMCGWIIKETRARRLINSTATAADIKQLELEVESRNKGETIEELATRQIFISDELALSNAFLDGYESFYINSIEIATKRSEIDNLLAQYKIDVNNKLQETKQYSEL